MATSLDLARTYTSYSGVDIRVIINGAQVGSMQALSYAIQREKAPIYVMGSVDPISYSRGKRGIAGTMISLMMDTHILMSPSFTGEYYLGDSDEIFPRIDNATIDGTNVRGEINRFDNEVENPVSLTTVGGEYFGSEFVEIGADGGEINIASGFTNRLKREQVYRVDDIGNNYRVAPVFYVDQILPFDIAIVAANEYGQSAQMRLYGCEILNEGSGFSIDDIVIENQMTYVCRTILPWRSFDIKAKEANTNSIVNAREALYKTLGTDKNRGGSIGSTGQNIKYRTSSSVISGTGYTNS